MSAIREALLAIRDQHGYLTPELVVSEARSKSHPLHSRVFDRAPKEAAEAWYRHRAHELIQSVKITYNVGDRPKTIRGFLPVSRPDSPQPVYEPTEEVAADPVQHQIALQQMEREWRTFKSRWADYAEFADMIRASLDEAA